MEDPYLNFLTCYNRLVDEFCIYETLYIAFDFDNTIFDFHKKGFSFPKVENILRKAKEEGFKLILFTSEDNPEELKKKSDYCEKLGFKPDYINENPEVLNTKKPYYNLLLDDRAGLYSAYLLLDKLLRTDEIM